MKPNILFIDDEKDILFTFERTFRKYYTITTARSGQEAIDIIKKTPAFDVVVCDYSMPKMDGIQTLRKVKELSPNSVRIMLTGYAELETIIKAINENNIFKFLLKPTETNALKTNIDDAVEYFQLRKRQEDLNKIRMNFMSVVSQNYKNPLTAILTSTYLMGEYFKNNDFNSFEASVKKIQGAVQNMTEVIEKIIIISQLETQYKVQKKKVNIVACISDIVKDYEYYEKHNRQFKYTNTYTKEVWIDLYLFKQILQNIIDNAVKFSPKESEISIVCKHSKIGNLQISVRNSGSSIPDDILNKIYEPFVKIIEDFNHSATGLGLTITKKCIDLLEAEITIENDSDNGVLVNIIIPDINDEQ